jgi:hypothetical protein
MDIHLVAPGGAWNNGSSTVGVCPSTGTDCHFKNPCPDWGVTGDSLDDPHLDIDDVDGGAGALEQISLLDATPGTYLVYGYYYPNQSNLSPNNVPVTLTVRSAGDTQQRSVSATLSAKEDRWTAASISWNGSSATVTEIGTIDHAVAPPPRPAPRK